MKLTKEMKKAGLKKALLATDHTDLKPGEKVMICNVEMLNCQVTHDYQRNLDTNHVIMGPEYSGHKDQMPILSYRDGILWIAEGQHRIYRNISDGRNTRQALVYFGLTLDREADVFHGENAEKKRPNAWSNFNSGVTAKRVEEVRIYEATKTVGLKTPLDPGRAVLTSTSVLRQMIRISFPHLLKTLKVLKRSFGLKGGDLQDAAKRCPFQKGLSFFVDKHPEFTLKQLVDTLKEPQNNAGNIWHDAQLIANKSRKCHVDGNNVCKALEDCFSASGWDMGDEDDNHLSIAA